MKKTFEVQGPVELDVRLTSGEIEVDPTADGRVEVELIALDEESQRLVDDARIELSPHGHRPTVVVDVPQKRGFSLNLFGRSGIECRIRCPHDSGLSVRTKSADVSARGTLGGLNVATASGDVDVDRVSGGVNVKSASSDFSGREIGGGVNIQTASGDIDISVARGPVNVTSVSGDISIGEAYDNVNANSVSGDQDHGAVMQGVVAAHSVSGDVTIAVRRGSKAFLDCTTVSGDTTSELELTAEAPASDGPLVEIRAKTVSGDIRITRASAPADTQEVHA
jgi:Putative adhesin